MSDDKQYDIIMWLLGILSAIAISISSFTLYWIFDANATIRTLSANIEAFNELDREVNFKELKVKIEDFLNDTSKDETQDRQLRKHWKLHNWERAEINDIRYKNNLPPSNWPDLGE